MGARPGYEWKVQRLVRLISFGVLFASRLMSCIVSATLSPVSIGECVAERKLLLQALIFYFAFFVFGVILGVDLFSVQLEREDRERDVQLKEELELKRLEAGLARAREVELKKMEAETTVKLRHLVLQQASLPATASIPTV